MKQWYVAKAKPGKVWTNVLKRHVERLIVDELRDIEIYDPEIPGKSLEDKKFLFPGYLFLSFDLESPDWTMIKWSIGLNYFLGFPGEPTPVDQDIMTYVRDLERFYIEKGSILENLQPGDNVVINEGPFKGLEAKVDTYSGANERCNVLLKMVGSNEAQYGPRVNINPKSLDSI